MKEREFDHFDHFANDYRDIHNTTLKISGAESDYFSFHKIEIINSENQNKSIKFLDFGCGDGNSAKHCNQLMPQSNYFGIDVSEKSIEVANTKSSNTNNFTHFDGYNIPYENDFFDVVFAANVFHHIHFELHLNLFKEIYRVLKKGGKFYLFEHNPWNPITRHIVNTCPFDDDAVLLNPIYSKKTFKKLNFESVKINFILFFPRNKVFQPFLSVEKKLKKIPFGGQYYAVSTK
jgi:SAM-dependent methyltransferase